MWFGVWMYLNGTSALGDKTVFGFSSKCVVALPQVGNIVHLDILQFGMNSIIY